MIFRNSIANFIGQLIFPVISIILVPFYIHYLGLEGYGLVGFFSMLLILLNIFTKGLGSALQREFARRDGLLELRPTTPGLLRTFEITYWIIGFVLGLVLILFSGLLSTDWLKTETITPETLRICLLLISVSIAVTFPNSVYQAVFIGAQRQVVGNTLNSGFAIMQAILSAIVVWLWQSVVGFYINSVVIAVIQLLVTRYLAYRVLPAPEQPQNIIFDWSEIKKLWKISMDLIWINGIGLVITQADRVVISRLLPISFLGIYNIGVSGARLLDTFYAPFLSATYPQTCQLAQLNDLTDFARHLIRNTKVMMVICMTVGLPLSFFAPEILAIWTRNTEVIMGGSAVLSVYVIGYILLSYATVFYQGIMALGKTRYTTWYVTLALLWYPLTVLFLVNRLQIVGAAWAWILYAGTSLVMNFAVMIGILLRANLVRTYTERIVLTTLAGIVVSLSARSMASSFYPDLIWGRMFLAGLGAIVTASVCYIICFGFGIPDELKAIFEK